MIIGRGENDPVIIICRVLRRQVSFNNSLMLGLLCKVLLSPLFQVGIAGCTTRGLEYQVDAGGAFQVIKTYIETF